MANQVEGRRHGVGTRHRPRRLTNCGHIRWKGRGRVAKAKPSRSPKALYYGDDLDVLLEAQRHAVDDTQLSLAV